jgi:prepilin-type N-terminal cleavage/methylation domain-containing protein/prepilin-type processing-associated H-X9-DG protein
MRKQFKGFTLIELLVVIAIIAILAAILFPVFAQAKTTAKASVELSNSKQITLAQLMYLTDNDDMFPKGGTINGAWGTGECNAEIGCKSWDKLVHPYMKNWEILDSPLDRSQSVPFPGGRIKRSFKAAQNIFSGMDGKWWAPSELSRPSKNMGAVGQPAGTIMLTNERNEGVYSGTWWIWSTWYENWIWWTVAGNTRPNNAAFSSPNVADATIAELGGPNNYWRGVDVSANNRATFTFTDGHVKSFPAGYIFPGYERRASWNQPVRDDFRGVCLAADQWGGDPANECRIPQ